MIDVTFPKAMKLLYIAECAQTADDEIISIKFVFENNQICEVDIRCIGND